ncbi:MAG TPA: DUF5667 domain-containing protein [Sporichthyaceae bacterium]|jgi:hypothetical protein|nr:DUF5667 domain-containing protein [Sporichthyaceae bacterium]
MTVRPAERRGSRQFAAALESAVPADAQAMMLARLAGGLSAAGAIVGPNADFRDLLRRRLLAVGVTPLARPSAIAPWRRRLVAAGAVLTLSTGGIAATAVASTHALPGERLYEVKRAVEDVQLALANGDRAKGEQYLSIAGNRLSEVQALLRKNAGQSADPVLVQELRDTLSDMSDALAAGSNRLFAAFDHAADAKVLAPLEEFVARRSATLDAVRALLPAELLPKQDSLIGQVQGIAARVASATGGSVPAASLDRTVHAVPLRAAAAPAPAARASRSGSDRDDLNGWTSHTVRSVDDAVAAAGQGAHTAAAAQQPRAPRHQSEFERNVRHLVDSEVLDPTGQPSVEMASGDVAPDYTDGSVHSTPAASAAGNGSWLLGLLPLPDSSIDAMIPGSLTSGLDFSLARLGGHYTHLQSDR